MEQGNAPFLYVGCYKLSISARIEGSGYINIDQLMRGALYGSHIKYNQVMAHFGKFSSFDEAAGFFFVHVTHSCGF